MGKLRMLAAVLAVTLVSLPSSVLAQGTASISGRVTDAGNSAPLSGATVVLGGTTRRTVTDGQGNYRLANLPAGSYSVSASLIGRDGQTRQVRLAAGENATVNFTLGFSSVAIEGLVVQATGEQQRAREVGNSVGRVNVAEDVPLAAVNDVSQVLQGRTAGVTVLQASGTAGTGARIRIRGSNSVSLNNEPLLIIDGVRTDNSGTMVTGVGGQSTSRLTDLNPEEIESIEILKGPAASALYGTAAANGVIVVTTKKGRAGRTQVRAYTEVGTTEDVTEFPANANAYCSFPNPNAPGGRTNFSYCDLAVQANPTAFGLPATTRLDSIVSFNPLEDPRSTPFETGSRRKFGLSLSGGSERATYFFGADLENEGGVYRFGLNDLERRSLRANVHAQINDQIDVTVNSGYVNNEIRLPQNDNNALGVVSGALLSSRIRYDSVSQGYGFGITPAQIALINTRENVNRFTGSVLANFRPSSWLSFTGRVGFDAVDRFEFEHTPANAVPYNAVFLQGYRQTGRSRGAAYTANVNGSANFGLGERITGMTSVGVQYSEDIIRGINAFGALVLPGTESLGGTSARFSIGEQNFQVRTVGGYFQQQFGLNDRLFVTGAVRMDRNSAFGRDFGFVHYPSISASWVVLEEPWFPQPSFLSSLRLRAAYGTSGLRPGTLDAIQFNNPVVASVSGTSLPAFTVGGSGNPDLRPEKSSEVELGFDMGLFDDRVSVELTHFDKESRDALINVPLAPSLGLSATRRENLGSVTNTGLELLVNARIVERGNFRWDATVTHTRLRNELQSLGEDIQPIIFGLGGNTQRHTPGRPLGAYFARPYTFADEDGNGLIGHDEIEFTSDTTVFVGSPFPTREASLQSNLQLGVFRLSGMLDYRGGFQNFNSTREFRCGSFFNCPEIFDPATPLEDQAAAIASGYHDSWYGYIEDASFVKLREVALTVGLPRGLAERFRAQGLSLTLSGRNLGTWTDYKGFDPEINFAGSGSNFSTAEFLTQPPARYFTLRLDASL